MTDFDPENNNDYAPNAAQRAFIRLCAEKYWYLALGEMDHTRPQIKSFALNPDTVGALEQAGKKNYFLESDPDNQYYFDFVRADEQERRRNESVIHVSIDKIADGKSSFRGIWLDERDGESLSSVFEKSGRRVSDLHFIAADHRLHNREDAIDILRRVQSSYRRDSIWTAIREKYPFIAGREDGWRDRLARRFINRPIKNLPDDVFDDSKTAAYVQSFDGPGAFCFGGSHFDAAANKDNPAFLGALLKKGGKTLCVLEIFADAAHETEYEQERECGRRADAVLYVNPPADRPSGIKINNNQLQPLFRQAMKDFQAGRMPQLRTTQFFPS